MPIKQKLTQGNKKLFHFDHNILISNCLKLEKPFAYDNDVFSSEVFAWHWQYHLKGGLGKRSVLLRIYFSSGVSLQNLLSQVGSACTKRGRECGGG